MLNCRDVKRKVSHVSTIGNSHMTNDILRIYSLDNFDEVQVSSELTWLRFLSSENSIVVPNPVKKTRRFPDTYLS